MSLIIFIILLAVSTGISLLVAFALRFIIKMERKGRRNPLTADLLRNPGDAIRLKIEDINEDMGTRLMSIIFFPVLLTLLLYMQTKRFNFAEWVPAISISLLVVAYNAYKLHALINERHSNWLGLDGEMAVGQELNQLMSVGYKVYHDFQVTEKGFNIDHVVIGSAGVFAVETKARAKKESKDKAVDANVIFDGHQLRFPGWCETAPIEQAKNQAEWLSGWLSKAVGENIPVKPVLAIPGWFVKLESSSDIFIFNGKNAQNMLKGQNAVLSEVLIKRISHQIETRCRNVAPLAYKKEDKKQ